MKTRLIAAMSLILLAGCNTKDPHQQRAREGSLIYAAGSIDLEHIGELMEMEQ